jgi:peptidoglycan/LPS O-acetylase OafA/YrhL
VEYLGLVAADPALAAKHASPREGDRFRLDVEGLRAVAIGLVLVYHAAASWLPGGFVGVDVFFVISGFLITGLLAREVESSGRLSLGGFYARRAKRLLPATALVLLCTAALTWRFLAITDRATFASDIASAALYVVNWRFASRSVDYLAEGVSPSPVQHFWSLAVEEQFYVVWPLLLAGVALVTKHRQVRVRRAMAIGLALVGLPSFAWSVHLTARDPASAFFVTPTRLWELALGGAVALGAAVWPRIGRGPASALGWAGLVAIVTSGIVFREGVAWPGHLALLPTLGAASVLISGFVGGGAGPSRLLGFRPFVWVGGLSYSLYLWHWPVLTIARATWPDLGVLRGAAVVLGSALPAWVSHRFVENPIRFSPAVSRSPRLALALGLGFTLVGASAGVGLWLTVPASAPRAPGRALGASAIASANEGPPPIDRSDTIVPDPMEAPKDIPEAYARHCQADLATETPVECIAGDPSGAVDIAIVGDSKMMQWYTAFDDLGKSRGWRVRVITKSSCAYSATVDAVEHGEGPDLTCLRWNDEVRVQLLADPPDVVVTSQRMAKGYEEPTSAASRRTAAAMSNGLAQRWAELEAAGIDVVVLLDNPAPKVNVYECVARHRLQLSACAFPRKDGVARSAAPTQLAAAELVTSVTVVDLTSAICGTTLCEPVVGGVLVYRQGSHLTDTYVRSLESRLDAALDSVVTARRR